MMKLLKVLILLISCVMAGKMTEEQLIETAWAFGRSKLTAHQFAEMGKIAVVGKTYFKMPKLNYSPDFPLKKLKEIVTKEHSIWCETQKSDIIKMKEHRTQNI